MPSAGVLGSGREQGALKDAFSFQTDGDQNLEIIEIDNEQLSVNDAIDSYLFNSQLLSLPDAKVQIVVPEGVP